MSIVDFVNTPDTAIAMASDWGPQKSYRCHICLITEDDSTYSAVVLNLPGAGSCGPTKEEALANVREAILGVIESHAARGEEIPWIDCDPAEIPVSSETKWILVNA